MDGLKPIPTSPVDWLYRHDSSRALLQSLLADQFRSVAGCVAGLVRAAHEFDAAFVVSQTSQKPGKDGAPSAVNLGEPAKYVAADKTIFLRLGGLTGVV